MSSLNLLNSPGKKQDHSSEHFNKQAKVLYKKKRTDRKKMLQFNISYLGWRNEAEACIHVPILEYFLTVFGPELEL